MALTQIDRRLLERTLSADPGAWREFVDRFIPLFVHVVNHTAYARSVRLTGDDVDDLCAEIFVALLANDFGVLRTFRGESSLATYLAVIARRVAVREIAERRKAETIGGAATQSFENEPQSGLDHEQRIANREEVEHLLDGLPTQDAEVVRQYHLHGKSYREISTGLGIPVNSVGPTLTRARKRLNREQVGG